MQMLNRCHGAQRCASRQSQYAHVASSVNSSHRALRLQRSAASSSSRRASVQAAAAALHPGPDKDYDVYVAEKQPLPAGEEKHVISVFVADEAGLINRVAGVFARRGSNIDSLAVGLNNDRALFTIVVNGTTQTVSNLVKQLGKLVKVRYVEDITKSKRVERELMLIKLRAPAGPARTEVLQLAEIFRARVVDVSERGITLCVSGDPGKTVAMQNVMTKFGVMEVCRTGRISLKRGEALLEQVKTPTERPAHRERKTDSLPVPVSLESREADVYMVEKDDLSGPWEVTNVLAAPQQYENDRGEAQGGEFQAHTLQILVADVPGVLQQVTQVFARRGYNVQSLAVGPSETPGDSRITMVVPGTRQSVDKVIKQVKKLVYVKDVEDITAVPYVARELMLIKVRCTASQRGELRDLVQIFRLGVIDVAHTTMTLEVQGREDKMSAIADLLEPYGVLEIARTGRIALTRESGVDTKYLETMRSSTRIF
uniref:ACT domain-containing protein n=1 Tax=Tetradesmus obliquus TaxID=3088 RepID=A0A383WQ25_TETOB|eukprot:jgi/Sobl393_1/8922/SZX79332.1